MIHKSLFLLFLLFFSEAHAQNPAVGARVKSPHGSHPNIIIFFTDDQGFGDVGCYPGSQYKTPNLDALAADGIRFSNFYVPATVCTPSRAGLLTGKYPKRVGLHNAVLFPYSDGGLSPKEYTMAKMLKESGYRTACIGKWHLGHLEKYMPNNHGFDYFFGVPYSNDMNNNYYARNGFQSPPLPVYRNREKIESDPDQRYLTRRYTEEAVRIIKETSSAPFFIYLAHNMPHTPLHVSSAFEGKSGLGLYGDVILELDWSVGELVRVLKEKGIYHNTLFIFTSDNGPVLRAGGSSGPLRGQKAQTWEGGQRVPAVITWPDYIPPNSVSDDVVTTLDLLPTFASIAGSKLPDQAMLDGRDVTELLIKPNQYKLEKVPFYYYGRTGQLEAVRLGDWKLHLSKNNGWNAKRKGPFPVSLFNLKSDIGELNDLSAKYPNKVRELTDTILAFDEKLEALHLQ